MRLATDLSVVFAGAFVDGEDLTSVFTSQTVDIYLVGVALGWLILRMFDADYGDDWRRACRNLPADTFIDPGEWESNTFGVESLFIPAPRTASP